jgi:twinkle protein
VRKKFIAKHIEWLCSFEEVVLMFDMDEPGRIAVAECAPLFPPGKCKVAHASD